MENKRYHFPETNPFKAREVTDIDFDIKEYENEHLYVNLDDVRITKHDRDYLNDIKFMMNIHPDTNRLETLAEDYVKIIFSGHRGSGKTAELRRIHEDLHHPERYFSVKIELENELEIDKFQLEDFYIILIIRLIRELHDRNVPFQAAELDRIVEDWLSEEELKQEVKRQAKLEGKQETGGGFNFLEYFKFKINIKGSLSSEKKLATEIRKKVKRNPMELIRRFNLALDEIRESIQTQNQGRDILFIIDGSERIPFDMYERIFIRDSYILRDISTNMICSVRIDSFYKITNATQLDFFERTMVPMIDLRNKKSVQRLREVITKRVDEATFFDQGVLDYFVAQSGGSIRQLIKIVHRAILFTRGKKISMEQAKEVTHLLGKQLLEHLTTEQRKMLQEGSWMKASPQQFSAADEKTWPLIYSLVLMKYNGTTALNPLLKDLLE